MLSLPVWGEPLSCQTTDRSLYVGPPCLRRPLQCLYAQTKVCTGPTVLDEPLNVLTIDMYCLHVPVLNDPLNANTTGMDRSLLGDRLHALVYLYTLGYQSVLGNPLYA